MTEIRRWNYDIYYDSEGNITTSEAVDITINEETYDIMTEHNRYECQLDDYGQPILDELNNPIPAT